MRSLGLDAGLAVNPETPFEACEPWLDQIDLVLVMTVHPGFGGQPFMPEVVPKIARTPPGDRPPAAWTWPSRSTVASTSDTAPLIAAGRRDTFVAGSAIFGQSDPAAAAHAIRHGRR